MRKRLPLGWSFASVSTVLKRITHCLTEFTQHCLVSMNVHKVSMNESENMTHLYSVRTFKSDAISWGCHTFPISYMSKIYGH